MNKSALFLLFFCSFYLVRSQIETTIFFAYDSDRISTNAQKTINNIPTENLEKVIFIGHCDSSGSFSYNQKLSLRRALNTKNHLKSPEKTTLQIVGKSFSTPNKTLQKTKNRRVEIIPIYKNNKTHQLSLLHTTDSLSYIVSFQKGHLAQATKTNKLLVLAINKTYKVENLHFVPNLAIVLEESHPAMTALFLTMQSNPTLIIRIEGHTNGVRSKKSKEWHLKTSAARAKTTRDYLISMGISPNRISTIGYGSAKMLYPNGKTRTELKKNRRVEIKVITL